MTADEYIQAAPTLVLYDSLTKTRSVLEQYQNVLVSVSGGADSDDMVDVVEHLKTERQRITYVWFDTGIEMAATKRHLADLQEKYKIEIKREKGAMPVAGAVKSVGYPFYSKNFSESIYRLQRHGFEWEDEPFDVLLKKYPNCRAALRWWCNNYKDGPHRPLQTEIGSARGMKEFMVKNPPNFLISKRCCDEAKKKAAYMAGRKYSADIQFTGVRRSEGGPRSTAIKSCMADGAHGKRHYPLFWWRDSDKKAFEVAYGIVHSDAYTVYGCTRTGCAGCPFAGHFEKELEMLHKYEPHLAVAVGNIFKPAYEYTRKYREFKNSL